MTTKEKVVASFEITFSEPDQYGEIHSDIQLPLSIDNNVAYIELKIDGREAEIFHLNYTDAGTIGYARMNGQYAIGGTLTNVSMNWAAPNETNIYKIIKVVGTIDRGHARLHLWKKQTL